MYATFPLSRNRKGCWWAEDAVEDGIGGGVDVRQRHEQDKERPFDADNEGGGEGRYGVGQGRSSWRGTVSLRRGCRRVESGPASS